MLRLFQPHVGQFRGACRVDLGAGVQADQPEHTLLPRGQFAVGQREGRLDTAPARLQFRQPPVLGAQAAVQPVDGPDRVVPQSCGRDPDRQREVAAQLDGLRHREAVA